MGENLQRSGREEAGLSGRGNSCPAEVGGDGCSVQRDMQGRTCQAQEEASTGHPLEAPHLSTAGTEPGRALTLHKATSFGPTLYWRQPSAGRCRSGRPRRSRNCAPMAQISETVNFRLARQNSPMAAFCKIDCRTHRWQHEDQIPQCGLSAGSRLDGETFARIDGKEVKL